MSAVAADIPVTLPPVAQVKLVLMAGIEARLRKVHGISSVPRLGEWARVAVWMGIDESELSRLRRGRHDRFSVEQLVKYSTQIGVRLTIIAE
jgi:hypothetical protein